MTGDLAGAVGVYIFSFTPGPNNTAVAKVHHHWVTDAGDTIFLQDARANAFQVGPFPGVYAVADDSYTVNIIGGTGRFAGAQAPLIRRKYQDFSRPFAKAVQFSADFECSYRRDDLPNKDKATCHVLLADEDISTLSPNEEA